MTLTLNPKASKSLGSQIPDNIKNAKTVLALKRYLDLTLTGTKKNLSQHNIVNKGRKAHPLSPYLFDKPELESSIQQTLSYESDVNRASKPPKWVQKINENIRKHSGEAPLFSESLLSSSKTEQFKGNQSRPLSGLSTKSAPVIVNGDMYYRPNRKYSYLQASSRPFSAKEDRMTRACVLRNKHRIQSMTATPSTDTQMRLRDLKIPKPRMLQLNKDLMPIPCHTGETAHSFIVGARYNRCNHMDARSYARLGLYVPRQDPQNTFLRVYKGDDANSSTETASDTGYAGFTSVRMGEPSSKEPLRHQTFEQSQSPPTRSLPPPHVRKVIHEIWLNQQPTERPINPVKQRRLSSKKSGAKSEENIKVKPECAETRAPARLSTVSPRKLRSRSRSKTADPSRFNIKGLPAPSTSEIDIRSRSSRNKQAELE